MPSMFSFVTPQYTGEIWEYERVSGPVVGDWTKVFTYLKDIKCQAMNDGFGRYNITFTPGLITGIRVGQELRNFRDKRGNELVPAGRWVVTSVSPIIDIFNQVDAYRLKVAPFQEDMLIDNDS